MKSLTLFILFSTALAISGCATSVTEIMQSYIGKDMREVVVDYGPPDNALDMGDGRRAFQWTVDNSFNRPVYIDRWGGRSPRADLGSSRYYDPWINSNTRITGGERVESRCIYTLFTNWDEERNGWIVTSYREPTAMCN